MWWLAFAALVGLVLQGMVSSVVGLPAAGLWLIALLLSAALGAWDGRKSVNTGHKGVPTSGPGWCRWTPTSAPGSSSRTWPASSSGG